jgi:hypothetical protein
VKYESGRDNKGSYPTHHGLLYSCYIKRKKKYDSERNTAEMKPCVCVCVCVCVSVSVSVCLCLCLYVEIFTKSQAMRKDKVCTIFKTLFLFELFLKKQ